MVTEQLYKIKMGPGLHEQTNRRRSKTPVKSFLNLLEQFITSFKTSIKRCKYVNKKKCKEKKNL